MGNGPRHREEDQAGEGTPVKRSIALMALIGAGVPTTTATAAGNR